MSVGMSKPPIFGGNPNISMQAPADLEYAEEPSFADPDNDPGQDAPQPEPKGKSSGKAPKAGKQQKPAKAVAKTPAKPAQGAPAKTPAKSSQKPVAKIKTQPPKVEQTQYADPVDDETEVDESEVEAETEVSDEDQAKDRGRKPTRETEPESDDEFSDELLKQASHYGLDEDEAREFGSVQALQRHMIHMDRQASAWARKQLNTAPPETKPAETPKSKEAAETKPKTALPDDFQGIKLELDPETMSEETFSALRSVEDQFNRTLAPLVGELKELRSVHAASQQRAAEESRARFESEMDSFFDSLGEDYQELFGTGPLKSLDPNDPAVANRVALSEEMRLLAFADSVAGRRMLDTDGLARRALSALHSNQISKVERRRLKQEQEQLRRNAVARPGGRQKQALSPLELAKKNADRRAREQGHFEDDDDESNGLLN